MDSLSEHVWVITKDKKAILYAVIGITVWFGLRLTEIAIYKILIGNEILQNVILYSGHVLLIGSLLAWLIPHFIHKGKYG